MHRSNITKGFSVLAFILLGILSACVPPSLQVTTIAGSKQGYADGTGNTAQFTNPTGLAIDSQGNLYIADTDNHLLRQMMPNGEVWTFAGSKQAGYVDGLVIDAQFQNLTNLVIGPDNSLYLADGSPAHGAQVRMITRDDWVVTLAGGNKSGYRDAQGTEARFAAPLYLAIGTMNNLYVSDTNNHRIRLVTPDGMVSTYAGRQEAGLAAGYADGFTIDAKFNYPRGIVVDSAENVFVVDSGNHCIRKITLDGHVTTLAGSPEPGFVDGQGAEARFNTPSGIALDAAGNLYVSDTGNNSIRKITPDGTVTTLAGTGQPGQTDGLATDAQFSQPEGIVVDAAGNVYVADTGNQRIRKIYLGE